ncbi:hypothetical protein F0562_013709 [Nyssa sinensis]|uniref:Uncharacterized protein n=1 Tax=Nyssa sinensis TaxID=561372 RepID=A0A5J4ZNX3_9ASTE|nr:hypothetical protein F0562_013709 [Nyssa sinensis]
MDPRLLNAAEDGDIDQFYVLVREDPYLLERIRDNPFLNTPLHTAAAAGHTHFAVEIASLKPSFGRMLNPDGFSPLHLAVQNGNTKLVKRLLSIDNQLVRVQGKQRITPLHYAAELGNIDLLAEFLYFCPKSIEDLTIRCETALHIAVKNKKFKAFNFLIDWLQLTYKKDVLNWKDDDGNTVLHLQHIVTNPRW